LPFEVVCASGREYEREEGEKLMMNTAY
jgi:hypothetical protein